ncbi:hypothetical protein PIB30_082973 [Stylosanthes scabra]|uniref:Uncharacterized protein n=1 Tax=Stylosanthes scabra TaxID=79078 RepID=A0ABU6VT65_9FABA|nr:hypothetical protein [Stylosanthes scabra]
MKALKKKSREKIKEIEAMGFGDLKYIPKWKVNQPLMLALASSYDRKLKSLVVGTRNIPITVELIGRCLGFPNNGDSFKAIETSKVHEITDSLKGKTVKSLTDDVKKCTIHNEEDRIFFRRHFLMLVLMSGGAERKG